MQNLPSHGEISLSKVGDLPRMKTPPFYDFFAPLFNERVIWKAFCDVTLVI